MPEAPSDPWDPETSSHPTPAHLRAYLVEALSAGEAERIGEHLEECVSCGARLDELQQPAVLPRSPAAELAAWDERGMRRAVRRTLVGTAAGAALLLIAGAFLLELLGWFVVHPLVVDRGDRVASSIAASVDLPVMTTPGAEPDQVLSNLGAIRRTTEVDIQRAVGARMSSLGRFTTRLGPAAVTTPDDEPVTPFGPLLSGPDGRIDLTPVEFEPERLSDGTAVTVELIWSDPLTLEAANAVDDAVDGVALLWVGFDLGEDPLDPDWRLGYSACTHIPEFLQAGSSRGGSGFRLARPALPGAQHALAELRRALTNLTDLGWPQDRPEASSAIGNPSAALERITDSDPGANRVVLTGPTPLVADAIDAHAADVAHLLEVDFDRGPPEECG